MISMIGIVISLYVATRMLQDLTKGRESKFIHIVSIITIIGAVICILVSLLEISNEMN